MIRQIYHLYPLGTNLINIVRPRLHGCRWWATQGAVVEFLSKNLVRDFLINNN